MPRVSCPRCLTSYVEETGGRLVCTECACVLEEDMIADNANFHEGSGGGAATLIGTTVKADQTIQGSALRRSRTSRQLTMEKARRRCMEIAKILNLTEATRQRAMGYYEMTLAKGYTKGRRSMATMAACLYLACREREVFLLLLDFSDAVEVNVYELGRIVVFLSRHLKAPLHPTDPCLYVMRFAAALEFGDMEGKIVALATRLVKRMQNDWMAMGRRPTGVCGAALLLAARYYQFNRTVRDVVNVVCVGEQVIRKRLSEFEQTPSAQLTCEQFVEGEVDLEEQADPPAFAASLAKQRKHHEEMEDKARRQIAAESELAQQLVDELPAQTGAVEEALEAETRKRIARHPMTNLIGESLGLKDEEKRVAAEFVGAEILASATEQSGCNESTFEGNRDVSASTISPLALEKEKALEEENMCVPTMASLGLKKEGVVAEEEGASMPATSEDGVLDMKGINDDELDALLLSEEEVIQKEEIWTRRHGSFIEEQERRNRLKQELDEEKEKVNPGYIEKKKQRKEQSRKRKAERQVQPKDVDDAIRMVVTEKTMSKKIDYDLMMAMKSDVKTDQMKHAL